MRLAMICRSSWAVAYALCTLAICSLTVEFDPETTFRSMH